MRRQQKNEETEIERKAFHLTADTGKMDETQGTRESIRSVDDEIIEYIDIIRNLQRWNGFWVT